MTIKIFYEYIRDAEFPYRAFCWIGSRSVSGMSVIGYHEAKADLLSIVRRSSPTEVPEPEEVEI